MRTIGILGASYCGSTVLGRCLGALPGVGAAGETHWILDGHDDETSPGWRGCLVHGADCPTWQRPVLDEMRRRGPGEWWQDVGRVLGLPDALVVEDKAPECWLRLGLPDVFLVPVRDAGRHLGSFADRGEDVAVAAGVIAYAWRWGATWGVPLVGLDMQAFGLDPARILPVLASALALPWDAAALAPWENRRCRIGGNRVLPRFGYRRDLPSVPDALAARVAAAAAELRQSVCAWIC